jgi:proteasome lid subunit RPN8/RPN11
MKPALQGVGVPELDKTIFRVTEPVIEETLRHLKAWSYSEAVCHWLGECSPQFAIVSTVWIPTFTATATSYDISSLEMLRLKQKLDSSGLSLLAQIHSHPGAAFHSSRDDNTAASPWPGFLSIVVPNFGRISGRFLESVECFELVGNRTWNHWATEDKLNRLRIL